MPCPSCGTFIETENNSTKLSRVVNLHTLHHRTLEIFVTDVRCPECGRFLPYDGVYDSIFCLSKQDAFTRELFDAWVGDVCGMGGTFRDAFSSWMAKICMVSAKFHRMGKIPSLNRQ